MKTISELQQEIRNMQEDLHNISDSLEKLNAELLNYKDSGRSDSIYKRIYDIAEAMPIIEHPIIGYGYTVKNNYFAILIMTATCEDSINDDQLLFLQRMVMADEQRTSIDLYMAGMGSILLENVIFKLEENIKDKLSLQLVLDMLIIANLGNVKTKTTFEVIANVAGFMGISNDELKHIAVLASMILKQSCDQYSFGFQTVIDDDEKYGLYLKEVPEWETMVLHAKDEQDKEKNRQKLTLELKQILEQYGEIKLGI